LTDKVPKKGDQPIIVQQVGVDDDSALDIWQISVVFQSSLQQTSLLAELANMNAIVMGEHGVT
jgi:hypothetical protein